MTFFEYYKAQFKDLKSIWILAHGHKKYFALVLTVLNLFNPFVIHTMYLYDTGKMQIDKRFYPKKEK